MVDGPAVAGQDTCAAAWPPAERRWSCARC